MERINFKDFRMYADIRHSSEVIIDIREQFADLVYKQSRGVIAHNLAFRILNSDNEIRINDNESKIIHEVLDLCTPQFQDSFTHNLIRNDEK